MGVFSWKTADTDRSIPITGADRESFGVYLLCPDNKVLIEDNYEGYGMFGGQDVYALLARWNKESQCTGDDKHDRRVGINMSEGIKYPIKIVEDPTLKYDDVKASESCEYQGYFYSTD